MRIRMHLAALVALATIASCGGGDAAGPANNNNNNNGGNNGGGPATASATVYNDYYAPDSLNVAAGTAVTWTWASQGEQHTVTFNDGVTSDQIGTGTFSRTFSTPGTYPYHCLVHGTAMSGVVVVQ